MEETEKAPVMKGGKKVVTAVGNVVKNNAPIVIDSAIGTGIAIGVAVGVKAITAAIAAKSAESAE